MHPSPHMTTVSTALSPTIVLTLELLVAVFVATIPSGIIATKTATSRQRVDGNDD